MALLALANLGLVLFDLSYIPWRNFYLKHLPQLTEQYGARFKGIEPHRLTTAYSETVRELENQVALTGIQSAEVNQQLLQLQSLSEELIDEDPFAAVNKAGTLERIKNRMRDRVGVSSSKQAFATFWSQAYLSREGWNPSISFFSVRFNRCWQLIITATLVRTASQSTGFGKLTSGSRRFCSGIFKPHLLFKPSLSASHLARCGDLAQL